MQRKIRKIPDWNMVAEVELTYKSTIKRSERIKITSSKEAYRLLRHNWNDSTLELKEQFKVLLLNASKVNGLYEGATGGIDHVAVDVRLIFTAALKTKSTGIILCHNHPSGDILPSEIDEYMTKQIRRAGSLLNIRVLDHIILTRNSYFSFGDAGLLKKRV